jgi:hypothetical protein
MEPRQHTAGQTMTMYMVFSIAMLLLGVGAVLARRNLALGRGDRRGAFRMAATLVGLGMAGWALGADHVPSIPDEMGMVVRGAGGVVLLSVILWLFYLAIEPYVRRLRPSTLVSWTRLLNGGFGDAVVGRDVLMAAAWGALMSLFFALMHRLPTWLGLPAEAPFLEFAPTLMGHRFTASYVLGMLVDGVLLGLGGLLLYLILHFVLRRETLTVLAFVAILTAMLSGGGDSFWLSLVAVLVFVASFAAVLLRFGLLAACLGPFFTNCLIAFAYTTDIGRWYAGPTLTVLPFVVVVAVLAFRTAVGGSGLGRYLSGEASTRP